MNTCPRCSRTYDDTIRFCSVDGAPVVATSDPSIARNVGRVLYGQFELRELAGRGATGTVWRAYQRSMDRIVAVKILHRELSRDADIVRRFLREARAIAKIAHPNIVTVHMVGETEEGTPYLVMEHVDGISLETVVEAQGAQPVARVVHLARQIASGLGEAHANGIVHRDLKPANLLVTDRGKIADLVKILDFGIAKLIHPSPESSQLTRGQQVFGTPHYMAPEQASGEPVSARTDLYALGVVLFRLSTGQVPFDAPAGMQVVLRHLRDTPPRPRSINPLITEPLEDLILALLQKRPEDRPADTDDVIAALDQIGQLEAGQGAQWPPVQPRATSPAVPPPAPRPVEVQAADIKSSSKITVPGRVENTVAEEKTEPSAVPVALVTKAPVRMDAAVLTGIGRNPISRPPDRSALWLVGFVLLIGGALFALSRFGAPPMIVVAVPDMSIVKAAPDLAYAQVPDRATPDMALVQATPDMAKKHRHHDDDDDDLPVTVFGADKTPPAQSH